MVWRGWNPVQKSSPWRKQKSRVLRITSLVLEYNLYAGVSRIRYTPSRGDGLLLYLLMIASTSKWWSHGQDTLCKIFKAKHDTMAYFLRRELLLASSLRGIERRRRRIRIGCINQDFSKLHTHKTVKPQKRHSFWHNCFPFHCYLTMVLLLLQLYYLLKYWVQMN